MIALNGVVRQAGPGGSQDAGQVTQLGLQIILTGIIAIIINISVGIVAAEQGQTGNHTSLCHCIDDSLRNSLLFIGISIAVLIVRHSDQDGGIRIIVTIGTPLTLADLDGTSGSKVTGGGGDGGLAHVAEGQLALFVNRNHTGLGRSPGDGLVGSILRQDSCGQGHGQFTHAHFQSDLIQSNAGDGNHFGFSSFRGGFRCFGRRFGSFRRRLSSFRRGCSCLCRRLRCFGRRCGSLRRRLRYLRGCSHRRLCFRCHGTDRQHTHQKHKAQKQSYGALRKASYIHVYYLHLFDV